MRTKITYLLLSAIFISTAGFASEGVSKDVWLKRFKPLAPPAMCQAIQKGQVSGDLLKQKSISYDQCVGLITKSLDRCLAQYEPLLPPTLNEEQGKNWGKQIGKCSGEDFYVHYIAGS